MPHTDCNYTRNEIVTSLKNCGIVKNDQIFLHSNIGLFGKLCGSKSAEQYCETFFDAIMSVLGKNGTLIVPTFSYSFCNGEQFIPEKTEGVGGMFSEYVRKYSRSIRSHDANFSVSAIGKHALYFTENPPSHSFGKDSFWERFLQKNGKLCRFNLNANFNTFIHYVERYFSVPYRYDKDFFGIIDNNGQQKRTKFTHFVRDLNDPTSLPNLSKLENIAIKTNLLKISKLGRGKIYCINTKDIFNIVSHEIKNNYFFLTEHN